jgi:hypothetical protein
MMLGFEPGNSGITSARVIPGRRDTSAVNPSVSIVAPDFFVPLARAADLASPDRSGARKVAFPLDNADDRPQNTCGFKSITTGCRAARPKGSIKEEGLMARTFVALGLFLATSIGFAGPAPAQYNVQYNPQYNNPQYNPQSQYNSPRTYPGYQGNQGYQGGQQGGYQGNQGYSCVRQVQQIGHG